MPTPQPSSTEFRPEARAAFDAMIRSADKSIYRMPTSCELYLRQYLGAFEPERVALTEALRRGVPERLAKAVGQDGYDDLLRVETETLMRDAKLGPQAAYGAVECWAAGLGRPPGAPAVSDSAAIKTVGGAGAGKGVSDETIRVLMALIAAAGGFLGGFLGCSVPILLALIGSINIDPEAAKKPKNTFEKDAGPNYTVMLIGMVIGGVAGGVGAGGGWIMGRGDDKPWVGFTAAFGTALLTGAVISARTTTIVVPIGVITTTFGAAYTAASRGGFKS